MSLLGFCCSVTHKQIGIIPALGTVVFRSPGCPLKNDGEIFSWDEEIPNTHIYIYICMYLLYI